MMTWPCEMHFMSIDAFHFYVSSIAEFTEEFALLAAENVLNFVTDALCSSIRHASYHGKLLQTPPSPCSVKEILCTQHYLFIRTAHTICQMSW